MSASLTTRVTFRVVTVILILWLIVVIAYIYEQNRQRDENLERIHSSQQSILDSLIKQKSASLQQLQNSLYFALEQAPKEQYESVIKNSWQLLTRQQPEAQLIFFSKTLKPLFQLGLVSATYVDSSQYIPKDLDTHSLALTHEEKSFLKCEENCYINLISVLDHEATDASGYILLRLPLDLVLWQIRESHQLHAAILERTPRYSFSNPWILDSKKLHVNNNTDPILFEALSPLTQNSLLGYQKSEIVNLEQQFWLINHFELSKELWICTTSNITQILQQQREELYYIVGVSLSVTIVTLALILLLLQHPIRQLQRIANTLPFIGQGKFKEARDVLSLIPRKDSPKEIVTMLNQLENTTQDIEKLHNHLSESIENVSEQLSFIQELIDVSNAIFVICNGQQQIQLCNKFAANILHADQKKLLGANFARLFNIDDNHLSIQPNDTSLPSFQSSLTIHDKQRLISWTQNVHSAKNTNELIHIYVGVDITERLRLEEKIQHIANHDELTGLINRRRLNQILTNLIEEKTAFYFLYIDLNYFKVINDTLGHAAGDKLLIAFADILKSELSNRGIAARTGGDEFTVVAFLSHDETITLSKNLIDQCRNIKLFKESEKFLSTRVGLSIGIVHFPNHAKSSKELHAYADAAMYENKIDRVSSYHVYQGNELLIQKNRTQKHWDDLLEKALEDELVLPFFQGIYDSATLEINFFEALCRVRHDDQIFKANEFIDVINNTPIMAKIDMYMLEKAIEKFQSAKCDKKLMINISAYTLGLPNTIQHIIDIVDSHQFPYRQLVLEITEQSTVSDLNKTIEIMEHLNEIGIRFALDDFGTGHSSLSHLQNLPVHYLKLDKSFIKNIELNRFDLEFLKNVINLTHSLNIEVIAEGIEDTYQAKLVQESGANYLQGFFFSRPQLNLTQEKTKLAQGPAIFLL